MPVPIRFSVRAAALPLLAVLPLLISARAETPQVTGWLIPADGASVGAMHVLLRHGGGTDSATVTSGGRFSLPAPSGRDLELVVDVPDGVEARFHPVVASFRAGELSEELRVVLVPRSWSIRTGRYAGTRVEISLERAFAPACSGCSSYFRQGLRDPSTARLAPTPTWPGEAFPLRVAFTGDLPRQRVAPRDSAAFWRIAEELEEDFGRDLLRPSGYAATLPDELGAPEDVILVESDSRLRKVGWGSTISQRGDIIYGAIRVRDPGVFTERQGPRLVKHELMHALGVGHTCSWRSVVAQVPECGSRSADRPTPEDVAYFEVLSRTREVQRTFGAQLGLKAALLGERIRGPVRR